LALAKIVVERMTGRSCVTHRMFQDFGVPRDSITHAIVELEALGIVVVKRRAAKSNDFALAFKWKGIASAEEAVAIRDRARHFGIIRRRKVERETARLDRARLLEQITVALHAPASAPALAVLDDTALKTLQAIVAAIATRTPASYVALRERIGIGPNRLAASLRTLTACGLITITRGRRQRNVYRLAPPAGAQHRPPAT
jgi:hypothetical protein